MLEHLYVPLYSTEQQPHLKLILDDQHHSVYHECGKFHAHRHLAIDETLAITI